MLHSTKSRTVATGVLRLSFLTSLAGLMLAATPAAGSTLEDARAQGALTVGYADEAPYAFRNAEGVLTGEAIVVAREVLGRLGVPGVEGVRVEFGELIDGLLSGDFDMIAAGMFVTPERCERVSFSEPTYSVGQAFVVAEGNPLGLHGFSDVATNPDARMGIMIGAVEGGYAEAAGIAPFQVEPFADGLSGVIAVRAGRIDAVALTALAARELVEANPDGVEKTVPFGDVAGQAVRGHGAFAFRNEDAVLREAFDRELADFLLSEAHLSLVTPYGFGEGYLPEATREQLCTAG